MNTVTIRILWDNGPHQGTIQVSHAELVSPVGPFDAAQLVVSFSNAETGFGANTSVVNVWMDRDAFSFLLRDVCSKNPIWLPGLHAIVTTADDSRSFEEIVTAIRGTGRKTKMQRMAEEPEYSYEEAARETRSMPGPAWLGITRDMRFFEVGMRSKSCGNDEECFDYVKPRFFDSLNVKAQDRQVWTQTLEVPELNGQENVKFSMLTGRGLGCKHEITRRLEDGWMPILNAWNEDEGIRYSSQYFTTLEKSLLAQENIRGTDVYAAHAMGYGHDMLPEQRERAKFVLEEELRREEETVMYIRVVAENTLPAPMYAFVIAPDPIPGWDWRKPLPHLVYDAEEGWLFSPATGRVLCTCTLEGKPMPQREMSLLLQPGQKVTFEYRIPHRPVSMERAARLMENSHDTRLEEAKAFWCGELNGTAKITLPEKRIEEMIKAGLMHIGVGYFGKNPDGPVDPIVGVYTGIGSESSPGIQFLDTMGKNDLARRAIQFFVEMQRPNGFMQNFGGYMLETGCVLWTMGEHYRMTRDVEWIHSVENSIVKACDYLLAWREENKKDELRHGKGYGMISGRVSDPMDFFHSFMLNAGTCDGLTRGAELLSIIGNPGAEYIAQEARAMHEDILESYRANLAKSPVLPASDGSWYQAAAPWAEYAGPLMLYSEGGQWFSHATFAGRDQEGAIYLVLHHIINPDDPMCGEIMKFYTEFLTLNNTGFSQSYYSPHPYVHALHRETGAFLREFYSGFSSLSDRETYSFWEHYHHASQHKLHEETWFLMRCRWMLCVEDLPNDMLKLMNVVPRRWLGDGEIIEVQNLRSYYGPVSIRVESHVKDGFIHVCLSVGEDGFPLPGKVTVCLPHPEGRKAVSVTGGEYCPETETVTLPCFGGHTEFELRF